MTPRRWPIFALFFPFFAFSQNPAPPAPHYVTLKWTASTTAGATHHIYRKSGSCETAGTFTKIGNLAAGIVTYDDRTVTANTTYCYYATASSANNAESAASNKVTAVIPANAAAPPTGLTSVVPEFAEVVLKGTVQYSANGNATPNWKAEPGGIGTISSSGLYTAPDKIQGNNVVLKIIATSKTTAERAEVQLTVVKK